MTVSAGRLVVRAVEEAGLDDFGGDSYREGLDRLCAALSEEAALTPLGEKISAFRLRRLLSARLRIEDAYRRHPGIDEQRVKAPIFILGLPRTGTTAASQILAADPRIRSLRLWESTDPVPPPREATQHTDPRIARTEAELAAMDRMYPEMKSLYFQTAEAPTECQDLLGMEFRTMHFDGMARVPSYTKWVLECDMRPSYRYHRRTLRLLQWQCPPTLWHLKTPVHMLALVALDEIYPDARFIWTHRDPAKVLGSVCSLIAYLRAMVSERVDAQEIGRQQVEIWSEAVRRSMEFRTRAGEERFADVHFAELQSDAVATVERACARLGLAPDPAARAAMGRWRAAHRPGAHGTHEYALEDFGLDARAVRERFGAYLQRFADRA